MSADRAQVTRVACYALVSDDDGRLLLCRMSADTAEPGQWTLPGGGVDFGEGLEEAAVREVFEETGLTVELTGVADVHSEHIVRADREVHAVRVSYWASVVGGQICHEVDGSTDQCAYFTLDEIARLPVVSLVDRTLGLVRVRTGRR